MIVNLFVASQLDGHQSIEIAHVRVVRDGMNEPMPMFADDIAQFANAIAFGGQLELPEDLLLVKRKLSFN